MDFEKRNNNKKREDALNNNPNPKPRNNTTSIPCTSTIWCKTETHNQIDNINYLLLLCCSEDDDDDVCGSVTIAARVVDAAIFYNNKSLKAVYCLQPNQIRNSSKIGKTTLSHTHSHSTQLIWIHSHTHTQPNILTFNI